MDGRVAGEVVEEELVGVSHVLPKDGGIECVRIL